MAGNNDFVIINGDMLGANISTLGVIVCQSLLLSDEFFDKIKIGFADGEVLDDNFAELI
eukprot:CAMPEP_0171306584 /NCGR_PEP_ID=MMETSP0816-20121228/16604_1 /TAXON_ID=420281 /ORGANISM="Proboscia inermis, Strain CCAP1064/1" /LENGTH=58 /DNA_ID=CAMNT_0011788251 /DNA_START=488 /DNA_END=664 /DNA_ORIENTATION=-